MADALLIELRLPDDQLAILAGMIASKMPGAHKDCRGYTVAEAAQISGFNVSTIRRQVDAGLLPKVQNVKKVKIPKEAFDQWMKGKHQPGRNA